MCANFWPKCRIIGRILYTAFSTYQLFDLVWNEFSNILQCLLLTCPGLTNTVWTTQYLWCRIILTGMNILNAHDTKKLLVWNTQYTDWVLPKIIGYPSGPLLLWQFVCQYKLSLCWWQPGCHHLNHDNSEMCQSGWWCATLVLGGPPPTPHPPPPSQSCPCNH